MFWATLLFAGLIVAAGIPKNVIFDTDIGTDIDDSVSIAYALQNPNLNVKMILTASGNTTARAQIVAKYLTMVGRTDIAIGVGVPTDLPDGPLFSWGQDFDLLKYKGLYYPDGVGGAILTINELGAVGEHVDIIAIAPCTNFPSMLERAPNITQHASVKAMSGSIYRGYGNSSTPSPEYNVATCPNCTAVMYAADWNVTTTPLDTCGTVQLSGQDYLNYLMATSAPGELMSQVQFYWSVNGGGGSNILHSTSIWYDAVAAYMVDDPEYLEFTDINVTVTADGYTVIDPNGSPITAALNWKDENLAEALYESYLAMTLATPLPSSDNEDVV